MTNQDQRLDAALWLIKRAKSELNSKDCDWTYEETIENTAGLVFDILTGPPAEETVIWDMIRMGAI